MSDVDKMYQAPEKLGEIQAQGDGTSGVTSETRLYIGQAAPWLKFIGVMGFIGCGFLALIGIVAAISPGLMGSVYGLPQSVGTSVGLIAGVAYLGIGILSFFPALFMYKIGAAAGSYKLQAQAMNLQEMLLNFKKWAKFNGILIIIAIAIGVLAFIGAIIYGIASIPRSY
jgi:hypothetical protein